MTNKEKLILLEEMLDLEEGKLNEELELDDIEGWDSMAIISLIALLDDKFGKSISTSKIKGFTTINDILEEMN